MKPSPHVMPVDPLKWGSELSLSNFINSYYQFRDVSNLEKIKKILIIGPGQGLDTLVFRWRGFNVTTFDLDESYKPDILGSVHDLSVFRDAEFDVAIASHVLEHLPVELLDSAISELSRVANYSIVYLPVAGRHSQVRVDLGIKGVIFDFIADIFNWFERPDGVTPNYCSGMHYWEIGLRGFKIKDLKKRFSLNFRILLSYRNRDWNPSYNFVLKSKRYIQN